jgi:hypothetical protein
MDDTVAKQETTDFIERLRKEAGKLILDSTVPIFGIQDSKLVLDRTGVLLKITSRSFIVTAAHNLDKICKAGIPLLADVDKTTHRPLQLLSCPVYGTSSEGSGAPDVAAIEIDDGIVERIRPDRHFITLAEIDPIPRRDSALYAAVGYPHVYFNADADIKLDSLPYCSSQTDDPDSDTYDADVHIALELDNLPIRIAEGGIEEEIPMPKVNGMSGCGIWRITAPMPFDFDAWVSHKIRLVGIQHSAKRNCFMRGSWISYAIGRIVLARPDLRTATKIQYPKGY